MSSLSRLLLLITVVVLSACRSSGQDDQMIETVKAEMKKLVDATINGKYEVVVEMTHPKGLEELGGKEKAVEVIKEAMGAIKESGYTFKVIDIGKPAIKKGKKDYFTVATYTIEMTGMGKKVIARSAVVGVSTDNGKVWKFINVDEKGEEETRRLLPDLPRELKVPKQEFNIEVAR